MDELPPGPWEMLAFGSSHSKSLESVQIVAADKKVLLGTVGFYSHEMRFVTHLLRCANALHGVPVELIESGAVRDALMRERVLPMEAE